MFLGPSVVAALTDIVIWALVEATVEMRPPYVGGPRNTSGLETLKSVPDVMSSPPIVRFPLAPLATRAANAGRVRFRPVVPFGKTWISAKPFAGPAETDIDC